MDLWTSTSSRPFWRPSSAMRRVNHTMWINSCPTSSSWFSTKVGWVALSIAGSHAEDFFLLLEYPRPHEISFFQDGSMSKQEFAYCWNSWIKKVTMASLKKMRKQLELFFVPDCSSRFSIDRRGRAERLHQRESVHFQVSRRTRRGGGKTQSINVDFHELMQCS